MYNNRLTSRGPAQKLLVGTGDGSLVERPHVSLAEYSIQFFRGDMNEDTGAFNLIFMEYDGVLGECLAHTGEPIVDGNVLVRIPTHLGLRGERFGP